MKTCGVCQREMDSPISALTETELMTLLDMTRHDGWKLYLGMLKLDLSDAMEELVSLDGDARAQLSRQMRCREIRKRLGFEEGLEIRVEEFLQTGESEIPLSRILEYQED